MVNLPAAKNSITSIVAIESDSKQREKKLVIVERVSNDPELLLEGTGDELVKEEVLKVLTAIGEQWQSKSNEIQSKWASLARMRRYGH